MRRKYEALLPQADIKTGSTTTTFPGAGAHIDIGVHVGGRARAKQTPLKLRQQN